MLPIPGLVTVLQSAVGLVGQSSQTGDDQLLPGRQDPYSLVSKNMADYRPFHSFLPPPPTVYEFKIVVLILLLRV
jgi:hypothetical protein